MQYLLQDLIKLPLKDRLYIIENAITSLVTDEADLVRMIDLLERNCSSTNSAVEK